MYHYPSAFKPKVKVEIHLLSMGPNWKYFLRLPHLYTYAYNFAYELAYNFAYTILCTKNLPKNLHTICQSDRSYLHTSQIRKSIVSRWHCSKPIQTWQNFESTINEWYNPDDNVADFQRFSHIKDVFSSFGFWFFLSGTRIRLEVELFIVPENSSTEGFPNVKSFTSTRVSL